MIRYIKSNSYKSYELLIATYRTMNGKLLPFDVITAHVSADTVESSDNLDDLIGRLERTQISERIEPTTKDAFYTYKVAYIADIVDDEPYNCLAFQDFDGNVEIL